MKFRLLTGGFVVACAFVVVDEVLSVFGVSLVDTQALTNIALGIAILSGLLLMAHIIDHH
jgi:hypothetical protein